MRVAPLAMPCAEVVMLSGGGRGGGFCRARQSAAISPMKSSARSPRQLRIRTRSKQSETHNVCRLFGGGRAPVLPLPLSRFRRHICQQTGLMYMAVATIIHARWSMSMLGFASCMSPAKPKAAPVACSCAAIRFKRVCVLYLRTCNWLLRPSVCPAFL
jgi:hypothetical protein